MGKCFEVDFVKFMMKCKNFRLFKSLVVWYKNVHGDVEPVSERWKPVQCDQMARLSVNFWPFTTLTICQTAKYFAKIGSKFRMILKNSPRLLK